MGGASTFAILRGRAGHWIKRGKNTGFFLHELVHHATGFGDDELARRLLGFPVDKAAGEDASQKLDEFFNGGCDPSLGKPPPLPARR